MQDPEGPADTRMMAIAQPLSILQWQLTADYSLLAGGGIFGDAFYRSLYPSFSNRVTLMTFSEFGRRISENGSAGTDALGRDVLHVGLLPREPRTLRPAFAIRPGPSACGSTRASACCTRQTPTAACAR